MQNPGGVPQVNKGGKNQGNIDEHEDGVSEYPNEIRLGPDKVRVP